MENTIYFSLHILLYFFICRVRGVNAKVCVGGLRTTFSCTFLLLCAYGKLKSEPQDWSQAPFSNYLTYWSSFLCLVLHFTLVLCGFRITFFFFFHLTYIHTSLTSVISSLQFHLILIFRH